MIISSYIKYDKMEQDNNRRVNGMMLRMQIEQTSSDQSLDKETRTKYKTGWQKFDTIKQDISSARRIRSSLVIPSHSILNESINPWHTTNKISSQACKSANAGNQHQAIRIIQSIQQQISFICKIFPKKQVSFWITQHLKSNHQNISLLFGTPFRIDHLLSAAVSNAEMGREGMMQQLRQFQMFLQKILIKKEKRKMNQLSKCTTKNMIALEEISDSQQLKRMFECSRMKPNDINNFIEDLAQSQNLHGPMNLINPMSKTTFHQILMIEKQIEYVKDLLREKTNSLNNGLFCTITLPAH